jgi:hypothetical protein
LRPRERASDTPESAVDTDIRMVAILGIGTLLAIPIAIFAVNIVLPPEDAIVAVAEVDPAVTAESLSYLTRKTDVAKVVVKGIEVFIVFNTKPKDEELAAIVNEAALKYAGAAGHDIYVHATHLEQLASIGTPSFHGYCSTHAGVSTELGDEGNTINKPVMIESTC